MGAPGAASMPRTVFGTRPEAKALSPRGYLSSAVTAAYDSAAASRHNTSEAVT